MCVFSFSSLLEVFFFHAGAFKLYDLDNDGTITRQEMLQVRHNEKRIVISKQLRSSPPFTLWSATASSCPTRRIRLKSVSIEYFA